MDYVVPKDDHFLRQWKPTRKVDQYTVDSRREYTDFFHAPGCYADTTNLSDPQQQMSSVNTKVFEVLKKLRHETLDIRRDRHGQVQLRPQDWTFFRFTLNPLNPAENSTSQQWLFQPLEKYKPRSMAATKIQIELLTSPRTRCENSIVFIRTHDARMAPGDFLDSQRIVQGSRTRAAAKALTGIDPVGNMHAELLVDAAIERKIITMRMERSAPLPDFWRLPAEVRGRIYQLAAEAEGSISPISIDDYHRRNPRRLLDNLGRLIRNNDHAVRGGHLVFSNGFMLPKSVALSVPSYQRNGSFGSLRHNDGPVPEAAGSIDDEDSYRVFATPALLGTSKAVREESIKILFVQPTFCFSQVSHLHKFMIVSLNDVVSSLRKMHFKMSLDELLVVFSLARRELTFDELGQLDSFFYSLALPGDPRRDSLRRFSLYQKLTWMKLFDDNDAVFVDCAEHMRLTHLTVEVRIARESSFLAGLPVDGSGILDAEQLQLARLLLVKLVNLTLDLWARSNNSRPHLRIIWPDNVAEAERDALAIMGTVYTTTQATGQSYMEAGDGRRKTCAVVPRAGSLRSLPCYRDEAALVLQ